MKTGTDKYGMVGYGIMAAGAVSASLVGQLPGNASALGPVAGVSYRVASRIANTLRAGHAVRLPDELEGVRLILFYSPEEHFAALLAALENAGIQWSGKSLIFCDCNAGDAVVSRFRVAGASVASLRRCGVPGYLAVQGSAPALTWAIRLARELKSKPLEISEDRATLFDAARTMGTAAVTPFLDGLGRMLRQCGLRDIDAARLAAGLVSGAAADYAHSGKQSWSWHIQEPETHALLRQLESMEDPLKSLFRVMLLLGFDSFDRHPEVAAAIRAAFRQD
jgi:hypothetical protein